MEINVQKSNLVLDNLPLNEVKHDATLTGNGTYNAPLSIYTLIPRSYTTTQKNALTNVTVGTIVYDSTLDKLCFKGASAWQTITST